MDSLHLRRAPTKRVTSITFPRTYLKNSGLGSHTQHFDGVGAVSAIFEMTSSSKRNCMSKRLAFTFILFTILLGIIPLPLHLAAKTATTDIASRAIPIAEQIAIVFAEFIIKPIYMLIALALILVLRRSRALDLVALKWSMIFFLAGEIFCAINIIFFADANPLMEYLHSYGMALCIGTLAFAAFYALDSRLIKYGDATKACAALGLCRECYKHSNVVCRARRIFAALSLAVFALAFLPLTVPTQVAAYNSTVFGVAHFFSHADIHQWFEIRYSPIITLLLSVIAILILLLDDKSPLLLPKLIFATSIGFLGFSFFRLVLFIPFPQNLGWFFFWEEVTELIFIVGVAYVLWIFRKGLLAKS
jgi:hypothetical protein